MRIRFKKVNDGQMISEFRNDNIDITIFKDGLNYRIIKNDHSLQESIEIIDKTLKNKLQFSRELRKDLQILGFLLEKESRK